MFCFVVRF
jgi:hypothetical protein